MGKVTTRKIVKTLSLPGNAAKRVKQKDRQYAKELQQEMQQVGPTESPFEDKYVKIDVKVMDRNEGDPRGQRRPAPSMSDMRPSGGKG